MATQDWPSDRAFMGAEVRPGADVSKSTFRGFYTGNRGTTSHLADRLTCEVLLPPCKDRADAARREAFFMGLVSTGDWVRFGMLYRREPLGTMRGSPTVNGAVAAGARSLVLAGVKSGANLLLGSGFETDTDADGLADGLSTYSTGTVTGGGYSATAGNGSTRAQIISATSLGTGSGDAVGFRWSTDWAVTAGLPYTMSVDVYGEPNAYLRIYWDWYTAGLSPVGTPASATHVIPAAWSRVSATATAPASAAFARVFLWVQERFNAPSNVAAALDNAQFEQASAATAYAGLAAAGPGDFIGIGGNLLQLAYAGATATDAGAMTVPLVYPAPKAISNGAAVTLLQPTGTWELDTDGLQLDYTAGNIQGGIAVPFRQVPV